MTPTLAQVPGERREYPFLWRGGATISIYRLSISQGRSRDAIMQRW